jgi:hypothetical protein
VCCAFSQSTDSVIVMQAAIAVQRHAMHTASHLVEKHTRNLMARTLAAWHLHARMCRQVQLKAHRLMTAIGQRRLAAVFGCWRRFCASRARTRGIAALCCRSDQQSVRIVFKVWRLHAHQQSWRRLAAEQRGQHAAVACVRSAFLNWAQEAHAMQRLKCRATDCMQRCASGHLM